MTQEAQAIEKRNKVELEKLHYMSDYVNLMNELESHLNQSRWYLSKTKSIVGFSNASANLIDFRDMEALVRVDYNTKKNAFVLNSSKDDDADEKTTGLINRKDRKEQAKKVEEKPKVTRKNYKPFGEFEPLPAKQARSSADKSIQLVLELASMQSKIRDLKI